LVTNVGIACRQSRSVSAPSTPISAELRDMTFFPKNIDFPNLF
jgi:hypothetical protein